MATVYANSVLTSGARVKLLVARIDGIGRVSFRWFNDLPGINSFVDSEKKSGYEESQFYYFQ